jgi:hypothetical protein
MLDSTGYLLVIPGKLLSELYNKEKRMTFLYLLHRDLLEHLSRQAYAKLQLVSEFGTNVLRRDQFSHLQHPGSKNNDDTRLTCHHCRYGFRYEYVPSAMQRCRLGRDSKA